MKNGVFEPFRTFQRPSTAKKNVKKGPLFAHSTLFCAFYFENFAVFFTSERTPFRKKSTPNFQKALTFFGHRPPSFSILSENGCEPATYEHPSKFAYFRPRTLFFRRPPVFWGVNRPIFRKLTEKCLQFETSFHLHFSKLECSGGIRKKTTAKWLILADFSLNLRPNKHRY